MPLLSHAGQVCLFDCIEWLREQLQQWQDAAAAAEALAASAEQMGLGSRQGSNDGEWQSEEEWDQELQQLPEASTSQVSVLVQQQLVIQVEKWGGGVVTGGSFHR
jgi:hypothetical protein